jgi:hypothetical protein
MNLVQNPFAPGAGSPPPALVGRKAILDHAQIALARIKNGRSEKSSLLVGLRGVGKTVLLRAIHDEAEAQGYQTFFIETPENKPLASLLLPPLRNILFKLDRMEGFNEGVKRAFRVFKSFIGAIKLGNDDFNVSLDVDAETGTADSGDLEADLPALLSVVAAAAAARKTAIALVIDEMQYLPEKEFGALIMALHQVAQKKLPLVVFGAGLPQLVGLAGKAKSYAERLFNYPPIGALPAGDAAEALNKPVRDQGVAFDPKAVDAIIRTTHGYPYFLQEWGYETWNYAQKSPISLADVRGVTPEVIRRLDENFFRVRFDRLKPNERKYLRAMAELGPGPHRSGEITKVLGITVQSLAPVRASLIAKGMIYSPDHGDTAFTVPLFDEFMKRIMPEKPGK